MSGLKALYGLAGIEAGCDEVGRGCLAGPVVAAAVILDPDFDHPALNDSKKISERQRNLLSPIIRDHALAWAIGIASVDEIDQINILNASFLAMHRAIDQLSVRPSLLLIDGNRFKSYNDIEHRCIIGGDAIYRPIAAASIVAKTFRDELMVQLGNAFPHYDWQSNKGYPTPKHKEAIARYGYTIHHHKSFHANIQLKLPV